MHTDYAITLASPQHLGALPAIELSAASRFEGWDVPRSLFLEATPRVVFETAQAAGHLWVALADGEPVGFGLVASSGNRLHLEELDVIPEHGRHGLGSALVYEIEQWASANRFVELTLTTYRDVPWNAPFYIRLGFEIVRPANLDAELLGRLRAEAARGLDSITRVALSKLVSRSASPSSRPTRGL